MKKVLFFSRSGLFYFFSGLGGDFIAMHVVINKAEKKEILAAGEIVVGCFEDAFEELEVDKTEDVPLCGGFAQDRFFGLFDLDRRVIINQKLIAFFEKIVLENDIDVVVHEIISCEFEEVLSQVCRRHNIIELTPIPNVVSNTFFFADDPYNSAFFPQSFKDISPGSHALNVARNEVLSVIATGRYSPEVNWNNLPKRISKWEFFKKCLAAVLKKGRSVFRHHDDHALRMFYYNNYVQHYNTVFDELIDDAYQIFSKYDTIDLDKEIIYFPLQYEPEATLNYFSPLMDDQIFIIQTVCKCLRPNQLLIVKEHPGQPFALLSKRFQKLRRRNSNLAYAFIDLKLEKIKDHVSKVVTISSTVGWEALVFNKPTFVFGNVFYDQHPNAVKFKSFDGLRRFIQSENSVESGVTSNEITIDYLARVLERCYEGSCLWDNTSIENKKLFALGLQREMQRRISQKRDKIALHGLI